MRFLLLLILFRLVFADLYLIRDNNYGKVYLTDGIRHSTTSWTSGFCSNGKCYFGNHFYYVYQTLSSSCINYVKNIESSNYLYLWTFTYKDNCPIICPPNMFNSNNTCSNICTSNNVYFNYNGQNYCVAPNVTDISKILGDKIQQCTIGTYRDGSLKIITENGKDYIGLNCGNSLYLLPYATQDLQVGTDNNISTPTQNTITCNSDENVVIDENGSVYCVPIDTNTSESSGSTGSDTNTSESSGSTGSDTNTSESSGSTGSDTNTSESSGSSSLDCCYYYNNPQTGDEWTQSNGQFCSEKYKCCIYYDSEGHCQFTRSDTNSSSLNTNTIDLNETNKILNNINNSINNNLKEVNKTFTNFNKLFDSVRSGNVSVFEDLKGKVSINPNSYQPFSSNTSDTFPTIALDLYGKHIVLIDDSYRKFIPFYIIKPIVIFVFVFSSFIICMKTD